MRALLVALMLMIGSQVCAGFVIDRNTWHDMVDGSPAQKGYAMGAFDQLTTKYKGVKKSQIEWINKINECAKKMNFSADIMVDIINSHYIDLENWLHPAHIALQTGLVQVVELKIKGVSRHARHSDSTVVDHRNAGGGRVRQPLR